MSNSTSNSRHDGRANDELRSVKITRDYLAWAEGSVLIEMGNTKVICAASVEHKVPRWLAGSGQGWITAEYGMLPRSTHDRMNREAARGKQGGRTLEIQRLIGRSLRAITDLRALGEKQIIVDCDVIQADGGTRTASITGSYIALADAINWMIAEGYIKQTPLFDSVAAISVGIIDGCTMLDLNYKEDSSAEVDMNVVMTGSGKFVELQGTAEGDPFSDDDLGSLIQLAKQGITTLQGFQNDLLSSKDAVA